MKTVQYFSGEYLKNCSSMTTEQIADFLEDFRNFYFQAKPQKSKLISMKVPETLLRSFKTKARLHNTPYQTMIKELMKKWLSD